MIHVDLVVVGGGITGLAAAWEARQQGASVVVLEADDQPGGKLRTSTLAGVPLDESADAFLARVPEALDLCADLGLDTELVAPATGRAYVWIDGQLRPLPEAQLLGVPSDLDAVADSGILSPAGLARAKEDLSRPDDRPAPAGPPLEGSPEGSRPEGPRADESVGALVRRRLGDEVLDRLVAPLVGGIWAGDCDRLSLQAATPALADARQRSPSLIHGAAEVRATAAPPDAPDRPGDPAVAASRATGGPERPRASAPGEAGAALARPVFLAPRGGMARLVEALVDGLSGAVRVGQRVERIEQIDRPARPGEGRWQIRPAGNTRDTPDTRAPRRDGRPGGIVADAVVVATPAFAAAPLVGPHCQPAADGLARIDYASVVLVGLAVPRDGIDRPLDGSGFLVPPSAGRVLTACSWTSSKWPHVVAGTASDEGLTLLRVSAGRDGDSRALHLDDGELLRHLLADLRDTMGLRAEPTEVRISRWWRSFPQPRPGHLARIAALESALATDAPGLAVAGAWARGIGIPACIRSGRQATAAVLGLRRSDP